MNKNIEEYQNLCELIWYHNKLYYNDHAPEISDTEYDKLLKKLEQIESENPHLINPASPTQKVSEGLTSGFKTVKHSKPMLSLTNTYSKLELEKFVKRVQKLVGREDLSFTAELKMDGIAVSVIYKDGQLYKAATRGDGVQGDDITNNIFAIKGLPKKLELPNPPKLIELRGEVFMQHEVFESLNSDKLAAGLTAWANPRNAAAGSLKLLDANETAKRGLSIAFYSIANALELQIESQLAAVKFIKELKLPVIDLFSHASNLAELWDYISLVETKRAGLPFDIDGVVIKLDSISEQLKLGATGKSPRWAIAYKFASLQATTRIHSITLQVGRTGIITPVAELEPVKLSGSTISRATLHNFDEIARKDIREGDIVTIEKGGDVIPKVVAPLIAKRAAGIGIYQLPTHCPQIFTRLANQIT